MHALQTQNGNVPSAVGGEAGRSIELAPGVALAGFVMRFERNEEVFAEEEDADFVYKVISGAVRDVRILADGRRQIGAFHMPGDVFGLECGEQHRYSAEAVVDCEIALVRRAALERAALRDGTTARKLWALTAGDLLKLQDHMLLLARKTARERVASFLMRMSGRAAAGDAFDLPMSRLDIADHLGLTIETVSRAFTQLERDHAIAMPAARRIVLNDRLALAEG
ncbi:MAG TPA: helix-turn-helix domain-containing protein [Caulobacteraceae bacterium]|nr:helix-turn-helix domain-containing protein [Caulobacteraceae bacterium]